MLHSQYHGSVGFQAPASEAGIVGKSANVATLRELYQAGKLTPAQALPYAKPIDHAKAVASGKVDPATLVALGVDLHKAQVAYNRATGTGSVSKARKVSHEQNATASAVEAKILEANAGDKALAALVAKRRAERNAAKQAKAGKVYSAAEIAALQASLAR